MAHSQEIWFIINFFSGTNSPAKKKLIINEIKKIPNAILFFTEYPNHASEIAADAIKKQVKKVIAVGGDGTINEVGSILRGNEVPMGIVPIGSGNGLARHLKIPMNSKKAIQKAINGQEFVIDTCTVNEIPFFCTAGLGFDAYVANNFAKKSTRGFLTYIFTTIQSFIVFKPLELIVGKDTGHQDYLAFAITVANASQYGNDAQVAPESEIDDGLLDLVLLKPFSALNAIGLAWRLFHQSFSKSKFVETVKGESFKIIAKSPCLIHFDGEPKQLDTNELVFKIDEKKLKVIV